MKLNADQLRKSEPTPAQLAKIKRRPIYIVCDNVLDTYNIGSIFRLADAIAASKVYLCGNTETPPNIKIARAAVGTEKWVRWEHKLSALEAIKELRIKNKELRVLGIEQHKRAVDFRKADYDLRTKNSALALVLGHETTGVSKEALNLCDEIVEIPMFGVNVSLNVMVSLAIVLYQAI